MRGCANKDWSEDLLLISRHLLRGLRKEGLVRQKIVMGGYEIKE